MRKRFSFWKTSFCEILFLVKLYVLFVKNKHIQIKTIQFSKSTLKIKLQENIQAKIYFIEIALRQGCSPVNLVYIFRTVFPKNTFGGMPLETANPIKLLLNLSYFK